MGANFIFLAYLRGRPATERMHHTLIFVLSRALFLGLLGGGVGWLGQSVAAGAFLYSAGLGALYIFLGLVGLGLHFGFLNIPMGDPSVWFQKKAGLSLPMGVAFGLSAPICAAPLFLALLGQSSLSGAAGGFISLALFGFALSSPLMVIAASRRASDFLTLLGRHSARMPLVASVVLIAVGLWSVVIGLRGLPA
jgi:cytochrome c-type biogenesis protein